MGRKELLAVLCWLTLSQTSAKAVETAYGVGFIDNISAESGPRLYRNVPIGVYASATPYASYSFHAPTFLAPKSNQMIPVQEESVVVQNSNGFLKDSYGQRFVEAPQTVAYKATFPQQYVQLQNLPAHLSQPLVATGHNFQYGQATPHFFGQTQLRVPHLQTLTPSTIHQYTASQPIIYANNVRSFSPSSVPYQVNGNSLSQQQPSSNKNVYVNSLTAEHFNKLQNEPKFQRIQEEHKISSAASNHNNKQSQPQIAQKNKLQFVQAPKETSFTTVTNGKKTIVNLITKPPLPLLDLTLLEPLTFKNPLVPQVQHFLPRINQVTYKKLPEINEVKKHQMEFVVQNTKSYDSGLIKAKPKIEVPKKKQKKQPPQNDNRDEEEVHPKPSVSHENPNERPEISYEINSPNYKETYSEQKMSYNKETESEPVNISYEKQTQNEPVHYSYEKQTDKKPVHYSFVHNSNEPVKHKQVHYENNEDRPKQLIYNFNAEEHNDKRRPSPTQNQEGSSEDSSEEEETEKEEVHPRFVQDNNRQEYYNDVPTHYYSRPEQRDQTYIHKSNDGSSEVDHSAHQRVSHKSRQNDEQHFQPIIPEYEEDITILPTHKPHASVHSEQQQNRHHHSKHSNQHVPQNEQRHYEYSSMPVVREKTERIIIKEGTTSEVHKPNNELMAEMVKKQEESEEDFEKAYKDAAYGFPAFNAPSVDIEKEIYNPESYGASRYHKDYNVEKSPLRQYEADGDEYPKETRSQYKDARDKTMEEYFLDYAVSRPESLLDRYKKKEDYYKTYTQQKPDHYFVSDNEDKNQKAKFTTLHSYGYHAKPQQKQQLIKYRAVPHFEEYNYAKEAPRDNSAYDTRPHQLYKSKTQFVEPQYQYGFEPLSLPRLLDSELAAMASNDSPKSEKVESKKKIYKTNWYLKKTSSKGGKTGS
ncbi:GATA zinc finger domain-containing protein 10-like [Nymphalis io]|uniref:GATA zinc finger domain-containing protein 10-like n=1 Tax=Inachis io TaxID=171585 RepID=UPI002167E3EC|nr:GATA zinc finger domain-containing protein 10-like [Nymphalis io]